MADGDSVKLLRQTESFAPIPIGNTTTLLLCCDDYSLHPTHFTLEIMPSRKSPEKSEAAQPPMFYQRLIDKPGDNNIEARIVHEKELKTDDIQWLLGPGDVDSSCSVGISPAYSKSGGLPVLACAHDTRILIIKFYGTKAYRDGNTSGTGTPSQPPNLGRRNQLENELLSNPLYTFYAFDLAPLALSLRLHFHLHLTDAIDIQSVLEAPDRSVMNAIRVAMADSFEILPRNITSTFERMLYEPNNGKDQKHRDFSDLVQRAWLCGYLGQHDTGVIKDKVPTVDMKKFSDDVRHPFRPINLPCGSLPF